MMKKDYKILFILILLPNLVLASIEPIIITNSTEHYKVALSFNPNNRKIPVTIINQTGTYLQFNIHEAFPFPRNKTFSGEQTFDIPSNFKKTIVFQYSPAKELKYNEITIKYVNKSEKYMILFRLLHNINNLKSDNARNLKEQQSLVLIHNNNYLKDQLFIIAQDKKQIMITIGNVGYNTIDKHDITVNNNLNCFRSNYKSKSIVPGEHQDILFTFNDEDCLTSSNINEYFSIEDRHNEEKILIRIIKKHVNNTIENNSTTASKKFESNDNDSYSWNVNRVYYYYFLIIVSLACLFVLIRRDTSKKNKLNNKKEINSQKSKATTDSHNNDSNYNKDIDLDLDLDLYLELNIDSELKVEHLKVELNHLKKELKKKDDELVKLQSMPYHSIKKESNDKKSNEVAINQELTNFKKDLFNITIETITTNLNQSDIQDNAKEWTISHQKKLLPHFLALEMKYQNSQELNKYLFEILKPIHNYFNISPESVNSQNNIIPEASFYSTHFGYYQQQDVKTPLYIKHFEFYINFVIHEMSALLKTAASASPIKNYIEDINNGLKRLLYEMGETKDRSQLLALTQMTDIQTIAPELFFNKFINKHFVCFNDLIKLYMYQSTICNNDSLKAAFDKTNIDTEIVYKFYCLTTFYFKSLFNIRFASVRLLKDKFDPNEHQNFVENLPFLPILFPEYNLLISTLEKDIIFDVYLIGYNSDNPEIENIKPIVVSRP